MPSVGRSLFLHTMCELNIRFSNVSMPSVGRSLFLPVKVNGLPLSEINVSMPSVGRSLFLRSTLTRMRQCRKSVNALSRAILISTGESDEKEIIEEMCQCPQSGDPYFYEVAHRPSDDRKNVSMPSVGRSLFLPCTPGTGYFSHFPSSPLHVFFRIF